MNIFVLSTDPERCAKYHCDKHVVKMCLEYTQILSIAARLSGAQDTKLYNVSHAHHPCTLWAMKSRENYLWLCELARCLFAEYELRYGNPNHKSKPVFQACVAAAKFIPRRKKTRRPLCMPEYCRTDSSVESYRNYYRYEKVRFATWKIQTPRWFNAVNNEQHRRD